MLLEGAGEILDRTLADKHLALAVLDKLLEIVGDRLRGTEVLHVLGHLDAHFLAEAEEVINTVLAGHHHSLEFIRAEAVFTEFLFRDRFHMIERPPVYLDGILLLNIIVW